MKVSDILRVKGGTLYTIAPDQPLAQAVTTMAEFDIGSLVVMDRGKMAGIVTFAEPLFAVLATRTVGNVVPPFVDNEIFTFEQLTGAALVFATFHVTL